MNRDERKPAEPRPTRTKDATVVHRDPAEIDDSAFRRNDREAGEAFSARSAEVPKPYSTEEEKYWNPAVQPPDAPDQRKAGTPRDDATPLGPGPIPARRDDA